MLNLVLMMIERVGLIVILGFYSLILKLSDASFINRMAM